ncbi:MAG: CopG family ribbon-helix-helix protein [Terriglobia bacterium]
MPKMIVRLTPEVCEKLGALAHDTKCSKSYIASEAIETYVNLNAWQIAQIKIALAEDEAGCPGVPHEEVAEGLGSWGMGNKLPCSETKQS